MPQILALALWWRPLALLRIRGNELQKEPSRICGTSSALENYKGRGGNLPSGKKSRSPVSQCPALLSICFNSTHHSPSVSIFLLLSTSHISQYCFSEHKWASDRVVFSFLILAGETMISTHTSEPLNSSINFSVFSTVNSDNFSFSFMPKKGWIQPVDYKELKKKITLQMFILKLKLQTHFEML